jgi:MscS family membrane protein
MRDVLDGFERVLREHPKIWPDAVVVRFRELAVSSLDIEVMAWFQTDSWGDFQVARQDILLQFMDVVERAGTAFALPTQTLHVASLPRLPEPTPGGGDPDGARESRMEAG